MKRIVFGLGAVALAALVAGCGYSEHTYAVQAGPVYERPVAVPGATYYGDSYYSYAPPAYVYSD
jgi:hypothetical protein